MSLHNINDEYVNIMYVDELSVRMLLIGYGYVHVVMNCRHNDINLSL